MSDFQTASRCITICSSWGCVCIPIVPFRVPSSISGPQHYIYHSISFYLGSPSQLRRAENIGIPGESTIRSLHSDDRGWLGRFIYWSWRERHWWRLRKMWRYQYSGIVFGYWITRWLKALYSFVPDCNMQVAITRDFAMANLSWPRYELGILIMTYPVAFNIHFLLILE